MFFFEGVIFKKLERDQIYDLINLKNDTWQNTHQITIINMQDQEKWFDKLNSTPNNPNNVILSVYVEVDEFEWIGIYKITNIDWISRKANVAWDLFEKFRGKGFGKKLVKGGAMFCFSVLNLRRLDAEILENNIPSISCAKSTGFVQEGAKRKCIYKNGKYLNSLIFGLLINEESKIGGV